MKERLDPNRPYNRTEINKAFNKTKAKMHQEALKRGQEKYGENIASYTDGYTGEELKGGDEYEYDHARSAEEIFNKYKATHSDKEIAEIVNHPSNIIVTKKEINRYKGKYRFEQRLANANRVKELGINFWMTKKALILADINMTITAQKLVGGFFNKISVFFKHLLIFLIKFWKYILLIISIIFLLSLIPKLLYWYNNFQTDNTINIKAELNEIKTASIKNDTLKEAFKGVKLDSEKTLEGLTKSKTETTINNKTKLKEIKIAVNKKDTLEGAFKVVKLNFAKPLNDLTKSITDIYKFNSIVNNQNVIPVIGSMFEYNSINISVEGKEVLAGFTREYRKLEVPNTLLIEGFTCTIGSEKYNEKLANKRANNLKSELISLGVSASLIVIKSIGKQDFVSTGNEKNDLVINRRSNVTIISEE